jgi:hypothetical protein
MPTLVFETPPVAETQTIIDDVTGEEFYRDLQYYNQYPLPLKVDQIDRNFLVDNIERLNELAFVKLSSLCETYFPFSKLLQLARVKHGPEDYSAISNHSFFVCIGTKAAYDNKLKIPQNMRSKQNMSLFIKDITDSQTLFVEFLRKFFKEDESDVLEKTYASSEILTIALFYREPSKTNRFPNRTVFTDHLIAVSSLVIDLQPSCLMTWLGVTNKFPCIKPAGYTGNNKAEELEKIQGQFKIGAFLICTCQWLVSLKKIVGFLFYVKFIKKHQKAPYNFIEKCFLYSLVNTINLFTPNIYSVAIILLTMIFSCFGWHYCIRCSIYSYLR